MAQKRPVAPDTPITSYPTPKVSDVVITVDVDSRLPGYKPLEYGELYYDQTRFPGAKLISQAPLDDDRFVRRIYATDRVDQDTYNYAIKYSAGSPDHPIYTRTSLELREGYAPLADGAPDPLIPGAYLVDEEAAPADGELNSLYLKVLRVYETLPGPVVTGYDTNEAGQKVTITAQRKSSTGYELPAATALKSASAEADGTGVVTEQIRSIPSIFTRKQFSAERPDMLPQKFRAAVPDVETSEIVEGTATQPVLQQGDISASQTQQTLFLKQVSRRSRTAPSYPVVIEESTVTRQGQLASTVSTLEDSIQTADTGPLIVESQVTDLGDGRSIKVTTSVDQVFGEPSFTKAREDTTPQKFRAAITETSEEVTIAGTAAMPSTLPTGTLSKTEQQVTVDKKRVQERKRDIATVPNLSGEIFVTDLGGGTASVIEKYGSNPTISPGFGTISAEKEALGDGNFITKEVVLQNPPELQGQIYDELLDITFPFTRQVIPSTNPLGDEHAEITPKDIHHSVSTVFNVEEFRTKAFQEFWSVPAYIDVKLPDVLLSVSIIYAKSVSSGGATGTGNSWSISAQGSTSMSGEMRAVISNGYNGPVPSTRYVFFLDKNSASTDAVLSKLNTSPEYQPGGARAGNPVATWPVIFTRPETITIHGGSVTKQVTQSLTIGTGGNPGSNSSSTSFAGDARVGFVTIQPTLHAAIPVTRGADVVVSDQSGSGGTISVTAPTLTPSYSPTSLQATNYTRFPTGNFLASIDTESYKYGMVRVTAVVAHITSQYTQNS